MLNTSENVARINQCMDYMRQFTDLEGDLIRIFRIILNYSAKVFELFTFLNNIAIFVLSDLGKLYGILIFCKIMLFPLKHP